MGKQKSPFGLEKVWRKRRREALQAMGMLLGATWDKPTAMFIKTVHSQAGGVPTNWTTYFNAKGEEITIKEASRRVRNSDKRMINELPMTEGGRRGKSFNSPPKGMTINEEYDTWSHSSDAFRYARMGAMHTRR